MTFSSSLSHSSTSRLRQVPVAFQQHKWGFSDVPCEQLCSKTLCKGLSATTAAGPICYSGYRAPAVLLPPSANSISPLPHKVTWPVFSLPSVQQLPHSSPVPQGNSSVHNGEMTQYYFQGLWCWQELICDTSKRRTRTLQELILQLRCFQLAE